jgi:Cu(I)/Ag(I) efflux system membrane fusion protein
MSSNGPSAGAGVSSPELTGAAEPPRSRWQQFRLIVKVVELRLRFIALMAMTGFLFAYWDDLWNRYEKWARPATTAHAVALGVEFYCPMHPQVVQNEPGSCPICGMTLARRQKGEKTPLPAGVTARVELAPFRVAQAGIQTAVVDYAPLTQSLTTVGYVAFDERRIASIVSKVPGKSRVETLYVNFTGEDVEAGDRLAELYSPELNQAIQELESTSQRAGQSVQPQNDVVRSLQADWREMARASAEKLKRWGITQAQIDEILTKRKRDFKFTILSPIGGHVFKKNVVQGQEVPEGYPMFEVVNLGTVWVQAQVYEHQLGLVHEGGAVEATVEAFAGQVFPGKVEFIQPHLDPSTRTVEVRYALENPGHQLRPGIFATVTLKTPVAETPAFRAQATSSHAAAPRVRRASLTAREQKICPVTAAGLGSMGAPISVQVDGRQVWTCCPACPPKLTAEPARYLARLEASPRDEVLSVPESAVIDTGRRKVVYVEREPGVFEGRQVVLGPRTGDRYPVLEGLAPGEKVAAAGAFLIDAESRLNPTAAASPAGAEPGGAKLADTPNPAAEIPSEIPHRH